MTNLQTCFLKQKPCNKSKSSNKLKARSEELLNKFSRVILTGDYELKSIEITEAAKKNPND